jgi:hypothetical protein
MIPLRDPAAHAEDEANEVKEVETDDGRKVIDSPQPDDENASDTDEWLASDVTVSGSDQQ